MGYLFCLTSSCSVTWHSMIKVVYLVYPFLTRWMEYSVWVWHEISRERRTIHVVPSIGHCQYHSLRTQLREGLLSQSQYQTRVASNLALRYAKISLLLLYPDWAPLKEVLGGQYNYREWGRQVLRQGAKGRRRSRQCQCSKDPCAQKVGGGRTDPSQKNRWKVHG